MIPPLLLLLSRLSSSSPELEAKLVSSLSQVTATTDSGRQSSVERLGQLGNHSASGVWDGMYQDCRHEFWMGGTIAFFGMLICIPQKTLPVNMGLDGYHHRQSCSCLPFESMVGILQVVF